MEFNDTYTKIFKDYVFTDEDEAVSDECGTPVVFSTKTNDSPRPKKLLKKSIPTINPVVSIEPLKPKQIIKKYIPSHIEKNDMVSNVCNKCNKHIDPNCCEYADSEFFYKDNLNFDIDLCEFMGSDYFNIFYELCASC